MIEQINAILDKLRLTDKAINDAIFEQIKEILLERNHASKEALFKKLYTIEDSSKEEIEQDLHFIFIQSVKKFLNDLLVEDVEYQSAENLRKLLDIGENEVLKYKNNRYWVEELIRSQSHMNMLDGYIDSNEATLKSRTIDALGITDRAYTEIEKAIIKN